MNVPDADRILALTAALGLVGCASGLALDPVALAQSWHGAASTLLGLPLGALLLLMIHRLTGGRWGEAAGPAMTALAAMLPLMLLIEAPVLLAVETLMPFVSAAPDALPDRVALKLGYLQPVWMIVRALVVAAMWLAAFALMGLSRLPPMLGPKPGAILGLVLYMVALTLFTTDWMQALEPEFTSTIYPMLVAGAQMLGALAATTLVMLGFSAFKARPGGMPEGAPSGDFGKLMLAGVLTWVYLAYMQWIIIWMGDLPTEAVWYLKRLEGGWLVLFWAMALLFAVIPFFALLVGAVRRQARWLGPVAGTLLAGYLCEGVWRVAPAFPADAAHLLLLPASLLAQGSLLMILVRSRFARRPEGRAQLV